MHLQANQATLATCQHDRRRGIAESTFTSKGLWAYIILVAVDGMCMCHSSWAMLACQCVSTFLCCVLLCRTSALTMTPTACWQRPGWYCKSLTRVLQRMRYGVCGVRIFLAASTACLAACCPGQQLPNCALVGINSRFSKASARGVLWCCCRHSTTAFFSYYPLSPRGPLKANYDMGCSTFCQRNAHALECVLLQSALAIRPKDSNLAVLAAKACVAAHDYNRAIDHYNR